MVVLILLNSRWPSMSFKFKLTLIYYQCAILFQSFLRQQSKCWSTCYCYVLNNYDIVNDNCNGFWIQHQEVKLFFKTYFCDCFNSFDVVSLSLHNKSKGANYPFRCFQSKYSGFFRPKYKNTSKFYTNYSRNTKRGRCGTISYRTTIHQISNVSN